MLRVRWAVAVLAGGLGLICGCSSMRDHSWFGRGRAVPADGCCNTAPVGMADGPILEGGPPMVAPPTGQFPPGAEAYPQQGQPPGVNGPLRPIPQAQPVPAQPSGRTPGLFMDRWKN